MKLFCFIFYIYLVFLSVLPCSDREECAKNNKIEQTVFAANHHQYSHQAEQCTPFCICSCCGVNGFELQTPLFKFTEKKGFINKEKQNSIYAFVYSNEFTSNIWQPPKLS